jgi:hypothetical protein
MELITRQDRKLFATDSQYHEVVGDRVKIKIIKPDVVGEYLLQKRIKEGNSSIIELKAIKPPKKKEFLHKITFMKDREFGLYYGIYTGEDRFHNPAWYRIQFDKELEVLNLKQSDDLKKFAVLAMHPIISGTPYAGTGEDPVFDVFDPKESSMKELNKLEMIPQVTQIIADLKGKALANFARYMGLAVSSDVDPMTVKGSLATMGIEDPITFIRKAKQKNRLFEEILVNAIELGVIVDDVEKGYLFKGMFVGTSKEEIIDRLRTDSGMANSVLYEINEYDDVGQLFESMAKQSSVSAKERAIDIDLDPSKKKTEEVPKEKPKGKSKEEVPEQPVPGEFDGL